MKQEVKEPWVAALRSGDFQQGEGSLRVESDEGRAEHCCLGVLMEIRGCQIDPDDGRFVHTADINTSRITGEITITNENAGEFITSGTAKRWGITTAQQKKLADFNDNGKSFKWIAAYIERYM